MSKKQKKITNYIVMTVLFIVAAALIAWGIVYTSSGNDDLELYDVMDGWTVDYDGRHYENVTRRDWFSDVPSEKNDVLVMTKKIESTGADRLTVRVYSRLSSVRVSIIDRNGNEKEVYFYGYSDINGMKPGEFLGSGYHFVELPQDSYGKTLKIMEMGSQDGALQGIPEVVVTSFNDAMPAFVHDRAFATFVTIFMFLAGWLVILLSLFIAIFDRDFFTLTFLGMFAVSVSMWCMCSSKVVEIFSRNIRLNSLIEYMSLYVMIIPVMALAITFFHNIPVWQKAGMFASLCAAIALAISALVLQKSGLAHIDFLLPLFHLLLAIDALFLIIVSALHWRRSRMAERFFESGIFVAAAAGILYMLLYYLDTKIHMDSGMLDLALVPAAFFLMTILIFVGYIADMYEKRSEQAQRNRLFETSGIDSLTGLHDNIIGESEMKKIQADGGDYMMVSFDLNQLGVVNIEHGNQTGDLFVKTVADILKRVFPDADIICRMGGDEFLVLYENEPITVRELSQRLSVFEEEEKKASEHLPAQLVASYGYAISTEVRDRNTKLAFQLANQRMYRMKLNIKNRRADS